MFAALDPELGRGGPSKCSDDAHALAPSTPFVSYERFGFD
jgi:hypothetical protein